MAPTSTPPALATDWSRVLALRLARQSLIERTGPDGLVDVVGRLVGLHAQVMSSAELQAAARIDGLHATDVREALWARRSLVKTWAFRQTLHLLTRDDLAEFVIAARSLERWHTPAWLRYFKMTEAGVSEVIEAIGSVLSDRPMTRVEVVDAVVKRVRRPHLRDDMMTGWGTFLGPAAQRGQLVFGPSDGRNVAFVDPSDWLGRPIRAYDDPAAADEALGRLIGRYLAAFPGSSREMIARWWGGGRMTAVSRALNTLPVPLAVVDVEGTRGLVRAEDLDALAGMAPAHRLRLLPGFDPFTNELPRRVDTVLGDAHHDRVHRTAGWVTPIVMIDGRVGGTWEIESGKGGAGTVVIQPFGRWRGGARQELATEVDRIAAFLDRALRIEILPVVP
ncbi:MAG TPA: winged helix DNA-binding domain-containing protein [Candidatus Limnocylindrales bacterium]